MKCWTTVCFDTKKDFVDTTYTVKYDDLEMEIKRGDMSNGHELYIQTIFSDKEIAYGKAYRFLSEISWLYETRVEALATGGGGHKVPFNVGNRTFNRIGNCINLDDYEKISETKEQQIALGLYREAISSNSIFYSFLSYFKIINLRYSKGKKQVKWIDKHLKEVKDFKASDYFSRIKRNEDESIGDYLYSSGRCAIAHCSYNKGEIIADADNYADNQRIRSEFKLVKELAEIFIKKELKILDFNELYRLKMMREFKKILGDEFVNKVINDENINKFPDLPRFNLKFYKSDREFYLFKEIKFVIEKIKNKKILASYGKHDWMFCIAIVLDF